MNKYSLTLIIVLLGSSSTAFGETVAPDAITIEDGKIEQSLTGKAGDAANGKKVFSNRKLGNCLACHQNNDMKDLPFHGEVGPELNGVAERWEPAQLRAILVNAKTVFGDETIMPAFYQVMDEKGFRVADKFLGKTIISAQDVEDVIAYLQTLK